MKVLNALTTLNTFAYRRSGGRIGGKISGAPVLLLDHVGRKSGTKRTTPLMYTRDGDDLIVVASRAGSDAPPAWWHNLMAAKTASVQVGRERLDVNAREVTGEERDRLWSLAVANYPYYDLYQSRTERQIPVILLSRAAG